jgi:hypothetical protein
MDASRDDRPGKVATNQRMRDFIQPRDGRPLVTGHLPESTPR